MTNADTLLPISDSTLPNEGCEPDTEIREPFVAPELVRHESMPAVTGGSIFFP